MLPLCQMTDFRTFCTFCVRGTTTGECGASQKLKKKEWLCQSADGARAGPSPVSFNHISVLISWRAPLEKEPNRDLPSLICWPRMELDHRSAFRASVLLACVIICSNVLCPVGAYLYNNRYAGWVKTPIHFWGSPEPGVLSLCRKGALWLSEVFCRDYLHINRLGCILCCEWRDWTKKVLMFIIIFIVSGLISCLRHNIMLLVYSRLILLRDGIWIRLYLPCCAAQRHSDRSW